jgi:hypothetical protein
MMFSYPGAVSNGNVQDEEPGLTRTAPGGSYTVEAR